MKVFVGMSGGVDSSVSALLMQKAGHDVTGVFIKGWYPKGYNCTWKEDRMDAMRVCAHLGIKFKTLNLEAEYKKYVADYFIAEYGKGNVPNPDVMCNKEIKFGYFYKWAIENGADIVATGHYAISKNGKLFRGKDVAKDQSYFLYSVKGKFFKNVIFPIGEFEKSRVREIATKHKLPVSEKPDSQGLCFLGEIDVAEFLAANLDTKPGDVLDEKGNKIGAHKGAELYTLGARHGFNIDQKETSKEAMYIVAKDIEKNTITVATDKQMGGKEIKLNEVNVISDLKEAKQIQYRYHGSIVNVVSINLAGDFVTLKLEEELKEQIPAGQSVVFYNDQECLGGGVVV